ncbi:hypothetical protein HYT23_05665 [Candidatus Pacearchaeota archaeon]|nr:hypothetical protein [Candidatus Pacearchaeota archaeon]
MVEKMKTAAERLREGNISLILDSYDDLFSDFDPRPYVQRALSDDFLVECKKASVVKKSKIELRMMIPKHKRNHFDEVKIRKRMKEHFNKHFKDEEKKVRNIKATGSFWFFLGVVLMLLGGFMLKKEDFFSKLIMIMFEPAGWFFFWEGLNKVFIYAKEKSENFEFYKKMANADIYFLDY